MKYDCTARRICQISHSMDCLNIDFMLLFNYFILNVYLQRFYGVNLAVVATERY